MRAGASSIPAHQRINLALTFQLQPLGVNRIIDIETDGRHLAAQRGFLTVAEGREEVGRVPLDDIGAVIVHAHGISYSNNLLVALSKRTVPLVICAPNHAPVSHLLPIGGHHLQGARMRAQWTAPKPLLKQAWRQVVVAKIAMQGAVAAACGERSGAFDMLIRKVRSGDPDNIEAQAARRYWPLVMGLGFRRDQDADGMNGLLNYGYTVLRATVARAIVASGLHPTIGIHHSNRANDLALADDLMEPYRPFVDLAVLRLRAMGEDGVSPDAKRALAAVMTRDVHLAGEYSPISVAVLRLAQSFAKSCETGKLDLALPTPPSPLDLMGDPA